MALELIVNVLLLAASVFTFWYVGATMPLSSPGELGAEQWPQLLLIMLIIALCYNLFNFFRKNKKEAITASFADFFPSIFRLFKSKLFLGMIILVVMAAIYEPLGFITTCFLFMVSYGFLLGAKKPIKLILISLLIMLILYVVFGVLLSLMLPRGYVPFLRNIAIFLEMLFTW